MPVTANAVNYRGSKSNNNNRNPNRFNNRNQNWQKQQHFTPRQPGYTPRPYQGKCQICGIHGHSARTCSQLQMSSGVFHNQQHLIGSWSPRANVVTALNYNATNWLFDTGATHHITFDLNNLALHQPYTGGEDVTM